MNLKLTHRLAFLICALVVLLGGLGHWLAQREQWTLVQRLEWITYDWRMRLAADKSSARATNLALVEVSDASIEALKSRYYGRPVGLYWPRYVYGQLVEELSRQGVRALAFDVLFSDRRDDHPLTPDGEESDEYFAQQLRQAGCVILAADKGTLPETLFRTNAWTVGDIAANLDADGTLRRARALHDYFVWHPLIRDVARALNLDLRLTQLEPHRLVLRSKAGKTKVIPLEGEQFNQVALYEEFVGHKPTNNSPALSRAFEHFQVWDMGIVLAARQLGLDLTNALIEPEKGRIVLRGRQGLQRTIPVDAQGRFQIDWSLTLAGGGILQAPIQDFLYQRKQRLEKAPAPDTSSLWRDKLVLVGSTASGNDLTDLGATPLEHQTYLTTRILNVANSVLIGRFIRQPPLGIGLLLILFMGAAAGLLTWKWHAPIATGGVIILCVIYTTLAVSLFTGARLWLPMVFPIATLWLSFVGVMTYRAVFEHSERRRIRGIFSKIVSPNVVTELLKAEKLSLGGERRRLTVLFADVRGFTELTDESHARAEEHVRRHELIGTAAKELFDQYAQDVLSTVNRYLGTIADIIKQRDGTLDKYIGDCVMAFWGAPTPDERHACSCVRAAIEIQRAIQRLNEQQAGVSEQREQENLRRVAEGLPPLPPIKQLSLGTGINTGDVAVGLMGSDAHIFNFTVFGREVNVASRLEGVSGRGRILIGEATFHELQRDDPALATLCAELEAVRVKGIRTPVKVYEVRWREVAAPTASADGEAKV